MKKTSKESVPLALYWHIDLYNIIQKEVNVMKKYLKSVLPLLMIFMPVAVTGCGNTTSESIDDISYTVKKEPTCTETGLKEGYDKDGNLVSQVIPSLGHDYDDGVITTEPTCEEKGVKTFTCSRCNETKTEEIDALGHTISNEYLSSPTSHYNECTRCHMHFHEQTHDFKYKKSTNMKPIDYFPYGYSEISGGFPIIWGKDENLDPTMGVINEYSCSICHATLYKAEFLTEYVYTYGSGAKEEAHYTYDDYNISRVEEGSFSDGVMTSGCIYEFSYDEKGMTVSKYGKIKDKDPFLMNKAVIYSENHKAKRIETITYNSGEESYYVDVDFTYDEKGEIRGLNQLTHYPNSTSKMLVTYQFLVCDYRKKEYKELSWRIEHYSSDDQITSWSSAVYTYNEKKKPLTYRYESSSSNYNSTTTFTYDSQDREIRREERKDSGTTNVYTNEYNGNTCTSYGNGTLSYIHEYDNNGTLIHSKGYSSTYMNQEYQLITSETYSNENEKVVSSKNTKSYVEEVNQKMDSTTYNYLKENYSEGRLIKSYTKETVDAVYPDKYDEYVSETTCNYSYNIRGELSRMEYTSKKDYVKESMSDTMSTYSTDYVYEEFPISTSILDRVVA